MKTITLTNSEIDLIKNQKTDWVAFCNNEIKIGSEMYINKKNKLHIDSSWVDKFREFLNNEIHSLEIKSRDEYGHSDNLNDLKSILFKLDKATDKPEEGKIYALTGGPNDKCIANGDSWKDSVVQNDKPKSYKIKSFEEKTFDLIKALDIKNNSDIWNLKDQKMSKDEYIIKLNVLAEKKNLIHLIKCKLYDYKEIK